MLRSISGTLFGLFGVGVAVFGWFFGLMNCDEGCAHDHATSRWWEQPNAWQWDLITALGCVFALFALSTAVSVILKAQRAANTAVVLAVAVAATMVALVHRASPNSGADFLVWLVLGLGVGAIAVIALRVEAGG